MTMRYCFFKELILFSCLFFQKVQTQELIFQLDFQEGFTQNLVKLHLNNHLVLEEPIETIENLGRTKTRFKVYDYGNRNWVLKQYYCDVPPQSGCTLKNVLFIKGFFINNIYLQIDAEQSLTFKKRFRRIKPYIGISVLNNKIIWKSQNDVFEYD